jgi:shikimate kinase
MNIPSSPKERKIIVLTGMMGSGKTTIGLRLADKLKIYFIDSDREIEDCEKISINKIFDLKGENYFRKIEKQVIQEIINRDEPMILSLGGGAFIDKELRKLIKEKTISIWLKVSPETILSRISNKNSRPLLKGKDKRLTINNLIKQRYPIYQEADIHFDVDEYSNEDKKTENCSLIIDKIIKKIELFINRF